MAESAFSKITKGLGKSFSTIGSKINSSLDGGKSGIDFKNTSAGRAGYVNGEARPFYDTSYDAVQNPHPFSFPDVPVSAMNEAVLGAGYNRSHLNNNPTTIVSGSQNTPLPKKSVTQTANNSNLVTQSTSTASSKGGTGGGGASGKSTKNTKKVSSVTAALNKNNNPYDISSSQDNQLLESSSHQGGADSELFNTPISSFVKGNSPTYNQVSIPSDALVGSGTDWAGNKVGTTYNGLGAVPSDANTFFNGSWTNPRGYTNEQMKNLTPEQMIALKDAKSPLESAFGMAGNAGQFLGGIAGLYGQYQNAKLEKDKMNIAKQQQRAIDANTSAFARAAGGTYTPTGV